jgi:sec-independent protein translocase protein TatA
MPFGGLSIGEMILIFAVLLLLFGPRRLPELAAGMGKGIRDFKRSLNGLDERPAAALPTSYPAVLPGLQAPAQSIVAEAPQPVAEPVTSTPPEQQP